MAEMAVVLLKGTVLGGVVGLHRWRWCCSRELCLAVLLERCGVSLASSDTQISAEAKTKIEFSTVSLDLRSNNCFEWRSA